MLCSQLSAEAFWLQISVKDDLVRNASGNAAEARAALEAMGRELQELREPIKKEASEMVTVHG